MKVLGLSGDVLSKTISTPNTHAYHLHYNEALTHPSNADARWYGLSVRKNSTITTLWYFARSGFIHTDAASARTLGVYDNFWSETTSITTTDAYYLAYLGSDTHPSFPNAHWLGFSVRCKKVASVI